MTQDNAFPARRSVPTLLVTAGLALTVLLPGAVAAQDPDPRARYQTCLVAARTAPAETYESARQWELDGGGNLARHCWAMALWHQEKWPEAARALEDLARETEALDPPFSASFYDAAARAWLAAGAPFRATDSVEAAVRLAPASVEHRTTGAFVAAERGDWATAIDHLSRALEQAPDRPDLLALRAAAFRNQGQFELALDDVERALSQAPNDPKALLERGLILNLQGDREGARRDWRRAADLAPGTAAGEAAALNLQRVR